MSNDGPKKTIMGWQSPLASPPGQQPQAPQANQWQPPQEPQQPQWQQPPQQPPQAPPEPQWQQPPQAPEQPQWQQPPQQPPWQQPPQPAWQQPPQAPQQPAWQQPPQAPQQPAWQQPPPQQPFGGPPPGQFGGGQQQAMGGMPMAFGAPPQQPQQPQFAGGQLGGFAGAGQMGQSAPQPSYGGRPIPGADATQGVNPRLAFIRMTYLHLLGAILMFAGIEYLLMRNETVIKYVSVPVLKFAIGGGRYNWLVFLGLFMVVGYVADYWARHATSKALQYAGLGLYVIAEAVIFLPLLALAEYHGAQVAMKNGGQEVHIIRDAAFLTVGLFTALTASVMITKKDFSFLRSGLAMGGMAAMVLIVLSIIGGFNLGIIFSFFMVALAAGYVLYYTSQVLAHYHPGQHVAAALALFSAIALMFWYVIRILMKLRQ